MTSGTDYAQEYGQAQKAYLQGNYEEAAATIERMVQKFPKDPNVLLLRANIYCNGLRQYELAREQYESVLQLTNEPELVNFANNGLKQVLQYQNQSKSLSSNPNGNGQGLVEERTETNWDLAELDFLRSKNSTNLAGTFDETDNPFDNIRSEDLSVGRHKMQQDDNLSDFTFLDMGIDDKKSDRDSNDLTENEDSTFVVFSDVQEMPLKGSHGTFEDDMSSIHDNYEDYDEEEGEKTELSFGHAYGGAREYSNNSSNNKNRYSSQDDFEEFDDIETSLDEDILEKGQPVYGAERGANDQTNVSEGFLEEFDVFNDNNFKNLSNFEVANTQVQQSNPELFNRPIEGTNPPNKSLASEAEVNSGSTAQAGMLSLTNSSEIIPTSFANPSDAPLVVDTPSAIEQGPMGNFKNASLTEKQWITAGAAGILSAIAVALVGLATSNNGASEVKVSPISRVGGLMTVMAGAASFGTSMFFGHISTKQIKRSTFDLQKQFETLYQGNYSAKATVYSKDEFGQLAVKFNQMTQAISTTTEEAQRRAQETEQAKEDLQRQVIRLLDDVEGAARGDLTVQAEVTADVLGAVADAFNLTIQNLREIVKQVKQAAQQVNKGATDSELFARNQYNNALAMAGELAVTLNSVQMMTDSIQRVAENAREAEEVARSSSVTALKGGESVERTVAGILEIRETVSETARKVKRLAEASQEISKIVAIISQISSRTNLLALNASIEAARAGEAGRGFAIVADEVRQLADKSAKSLKEIEQIVWQIQTETGSVMEAMEEGLQQVLDVTERAEQAKGSLEDIIQVSNRIDALVRSITASTVEQRENSRAVSEVMQSVELTAQATSRESQRVAGALQNLVSISQELLSSVERFRVDPNEDL
jgi:twitching motility protein PilJ